MGSGSLTKPKFRMAEYLSAKSSDIKILLNSTFKRKGELQVQMTELNKNGVSKEKGYC